ncbi:DUF2637 domain-containing protein [Nonomuraea sp. PA05]|uniref:DUF2637 domain-containing protein n=1 Tax=Nonomuraea sp. PA05 TaxID=2604466 RepID=UPI0011D6D62B|nr:DUF2637 domain-containing protein [Nonomuraea sp. PA05]TYB53442.1 DUF2637 domain-containing protein [Nonomuraea sp. PA05]
MRRLAHWLMDTGPVLVLALIAGAGSFTHIRDTASEHGQSGWMAWAIAVCIDLTCVMAARERQRDKKTGRQQRGLTSWPVLVLTGGIVLSLAANLQQADPTVWGWITAATPAAAFLVAVSMLERRTSGPRPASSPEIFEPSSTDVPADDPPALAPAENDRPGPSPALIDYARRVADEHHARHGKPITRDVLRARLGVSDQLASDLLRTIPTVAETT